MDWFTRIWVPIAIAVTALSVVDYISAQQLYRQTLNDPQVQIAEDGAYAIESGAKPTVVVASTTRMIDVATSLRPYTVVYDKDLKPLAWNATLDGQPPMPPAGAFAAAKSAADGENRVSWQPKQDIRSAVVIVHVLKTDGYVLSGRSMREVEDRIWNMQALIGLAWLVILAATLVATWIGARMHAGQNGVIW